MKHFHWHREKFHSGISAANLYNNDVNKVNNKDTENFQINR